MPFLDREIVNRIASAVATMPGLEVLFLFGSRARGDAHTRSDWDFAYLGAGIDAGQLHATLSLALGTDRVNVADLARSSGLLRARVARDGIVIVERTPNGADAFRFEALSFWCDVGPILERDYEAILAELHG